MADHIGLYPSNQFRLFGSVDRIPFDPIIQTDTAPDRPVTGTDSISGVYEEIVLAWI